MYRIPDAIAPEVWTYLDHREKDGYTLRTENVYSLEDGKEVVVEKDVSSVACVTRRGCAACEWEACDDAT